MNIKIKKIPFIILVVSLTVTGSLFAYEKDTLIVKSRDSKTFGDDNISQIMLQVWCREYSFLSDKHERGVIEVAGSTNIASLKETTLPLTCESENAYYSYYKPVYIELQVKYNNHLMRCGKKRISDPTNSTHSGKITKFSIKEHQCSWSMLTENES